MDQGQYCGIILAAGMGTRMRSKKPKVLHTLLGEPMLAYVIEALKTLVGKNLYIVIGHMADEIEKTFPGQNFLLQKKQLGTGHALSCALDSLDNIACEYLVVANGDCPLLTGELIEKFLDSAKPCDIAFASISLPESGSYGRVVRKNGNVTAIVEAKDFRTELHGPDTGEINTGLWLLQKSAAKKLLPKISNKNASGEYYLTDLVELGLRDGLLVKGIALGNEPDLLGINSPTELAKMENRLAEKINSNLLASGVILHHPAALRISPFAKILPGAEIFGPSQITGNSCIESGAEIGPFSVIRDSYIGVDCKVLPFSHLEHAQMSQKCQAGPFSRLRPGASMHANSKVGNFVELKNATLGDGAKANHLSYLGDATIGPNANIGAGTITCNFDGKNKFHTEIGKNAFIGSNCALVAPVSIGENSLVGAGSVITRDVPDNTLSLERNRQKNLPLRELIKTQRKKD